MRKHQSVKTKYLTVCAMLTALGVIFISLGSLIDVLDLTAAGLASLLCVYAMIEMGGFYPWGVFFATAVLSFLLPVQKTPAVFYTLFLGYYPILKAYLERLPRVFSFLCKLGVFHAGIALIYLVFYWIFPNLIDLGTQRWMLLVTYVTALACFLVYDLAITRLITFYLYRLKKRFGLNGKH